MSLNNCTASFAFSRGSGIPQDVHSLVRRAVHESVVKMNTMSGRSQNVKSAPCSMTREVGDTLLQGQGVPQASPTSHFTARGFMAYRDPGGYNPEWVVTINSYQREGTSKPWKVGPVYQGVVSAEWVRGGWDAIELTKPFSEGHLSGNPDGLTDLRDAMTHTIDEIGLHKADKSAFKMALEDKLPEILGSIDDGQAPCRFSCLANGPVEDKMGLRVQASSSVGGNHRNVRCVEVVIDLSSSSDGPSVTIEELATQNKSARERKQELTYQSNLGELLYELDKGVQELSKKSVSLRSDGNWSLGELSGPDDVTNFEALLSGISRKLPDIASRLHMTREDPNKFEWYTRCEMDPSGKGSTARLFIRNATRAEEYPKASNIVEISSETTWDGQHNQWRDEIGVRTLEPDQLDTEAMQRSLERRGEFNDGASRGRD